MVIYGSYMNNKGADQTTGFDAEIGRRIGEAVLIKGTSLLALAEGTGISYATIRRSVKGIRSLSMNEFARITNHLSVKPSSLIPDEAA